MTFLEAVNRLLRINAFIGKDDEDLTSFSDTQHVATVQLAKIAIDSTMNELVADKLIPYEETDGHITLSTGTRTYSLPSDFVRFVTPRPFFLKLEGAIGSDSANQFAFEYPGHEDSLRFKVLDYRSQSGTPQWFYLVNGTTKKVGFYPVPDSDANGTIWRFPYQKDVTVTNEGDVLPFHTTQEANAFCTMAARYLKYLFERQDIGLLVNDTVFNSAKSALMELMKPIKSPDRYGYRYE